MLERSEAQAAHFGNKDDKGVFAWENFRKRGGASTHRAARPKQFYPIYVEGSSIRIPELKWFGMTKTWEAIDAPKASETVLYPVNDDGAERVWSWGHLTAITNIADLEVRRNTEGTPSVFRKVRPQSDGSLPSTIWVKPEYSAVEHGSVLLKNMFNKREFSFPKSVNAVADCLAVAGAHEDATVLDIFAGSGSTAHAVMSMNARDDGERKFILIEANDYLYSFTIPRIIKASYSSKWSTGNAKLSDGIGIFMRIQRLEQYDETLENISSGSGESSDIFSGEHALAYELEEQAKQVLVAAKHFGAPFGLQMKRIEGADAVYGDVDLVESLIYLLGVNVDRIYREGDSVVITGTQTNRPGTISIFWRDGDQHGADWLKVKMAAHPADRFFTNDPASLSFDGIEKFEPIEQVFIEQMSGGA